MLALALHRIGSALFLALFWCAMTTACGGDPASRRAAAEGFPAETFSGSDTSPPSPETPPGKRRITDSRGVDVLIPDRLLRVATVSDALVEEVMIVLGVKDPLVGIGSTCLIREFNYEYESVLGEPFTVTGGMNPARFLNESMVVQPLFVRPGTEIHFETLASLKPDVLIIDMGSCTLPWREDREAMRQGLRRLESLGIPTIVLKGPNAASEPSVEALSEVIEILGEVFGRREEASRLARHLEDSVRWVTDRTRDVPDSEKPSVLLLGLNPQVRRHGAVGTVYGRTNIQSHLVDRVVQARNAYTGRGSGVLNLEQLLALDPDVIILPTASGYHPPRELYEDPHFQKLRMLRAVRERRVAALPWSPCNCDKRLEYPIDVLIIAWAAYPERFADVDLARWILRFFQDVYGVDEERAMGLLRAQWLDWTLEL
jgi:iron complex transport system substrate-binding protein